MKENGPNDEKSFLSKFCEELSAFPLLNFDSGSFSPLRIFFGTFSGVRRSGDTLVFATKAELERISERENLLGLLDAESSISSTTLRELSSVTTNTSVVACPKVSSISAEKSKGVVRVSGR